MISCAISLGAASPVVTVDGTLPFADAVKQH
jgi:hypothetical protein